MRTRQPADYPKAPSCSHSTAGATGATSLAAVDVAESSNLLYCTILYYTILYYTILYYTAAVEPARCGYKRAPSGETKPSTQS